MRLRRERVLEIKRDVEARFDDSVSAVKAKLDIWMERLAFSRGFQYAVSEGSFWVDADEPSGEEQEVRNYVATFVRSAVANRLKSFPNPEVPAANGDQRSVARADATQKLLRSFIDDEVLSKEEMVRALTWAAEVGGSWMKVYWDPFAGKPVAEERLTRDVEVEGEDGETYLEARPVTDEFGDDVVEYTYEGQIKCEFVDTIDGLPDPTAKRPSEMRYFIHRRLRPVSELEARFPKDYFGKDTKGRFLTGKRDESQSDRDRLSEADNADMFGDAANRQADGRSVMCEFNEYWEPSSPDRPNGMLFVWSGDVVIYVGSNPYRPARIPFVLFLGDNVVASGMYADGVVNSLIPLQRSLNNVESQIKEWIKNIIVPRIFNPYGSGVDSDDFGQLPQVIDHAPGLRPSVMETPNIPSSVFQSKNDLVVMMKEISSYSDISRGEAPAGIESGRAIAFLRENEQTIREPDMLLHKSACLAVLRHCLWLAKQHYEDGRLLKTLGEDGWELFAFKEDDFDWFTDLAPEAFSGGPSSRALRWAETMEAFGAGMFDDNVPGAREARKMLELDHASRSTVDKRRKHRNLARMENMQVLQAASGQGAINQVREFHDDEVHLDEHNDFRNSPEYLALSPQLQQMLDEHCEMHEMNLAAKQGISGEDSAAMAPPAGPPPAKQPGIESPANGGHPAGEPQPQTQDQFIAQETGTPF